jgi:hypothetical protein
MLGLVLGLSLLLVSVVAMAEHLHVAGPAPKKELVDRRALLVIGDRGLPLADYQAMLDAVSNSSSFGIQQYVSLNIFAHHIKFLRARKKHCRYNIANTAYTLFAAAGLHAFLEVYKYIRSDIHLRLICQSLVSYCSTWR